MRLAYLPVIGFLIGFAMQSPMTMMYPILMVVMVAGNRKAYTPAACSAGRWRWRPCSG